MRLYLEAVAPRSRALAFGSAAALVVVGILCATLIGGLTGQVLAITLITVGLGGALLLTFLEVGLSEDRARAREEESRRRRAAKRVESRPRLRLPRRPRRPG
jgi:threonine/homoserine/homoserine lactone efflux protein